MIRFFLLISLFASLNSTILLSQTTQIDSLLTLFKEHLAEPKNYNFIKVLVIGHKGCNIQSVTSLMQEGQFKEIQIPIPKGVALEKLECEKCEIDSLNSHYNVLKIYCNEVSFGITNNCVADSSLIKLSADSIYTISNIDRKYKSFEELEEIQGFGSTSMFTDVFFSIWLHPSFEFISIKENVDIADFEYKSKNKIQFNASNLKQFAFEVKYRRKNLKIKTLTKDIRVIGNVQLKIYDTQLEDGDIVNVFVDGKLILDNYVATNAPMMIPIKKNTVTNIRVENVNEGKIPPNTVIVEIIDQKKSRKINVETSKFQSFQINLIRE